MKGSSIIGHFDIKMSRTNERSAFEELMINNRYKALEQVLYDEEFIELASKHNLHVEHTNITQLLALAVVTGCFVSCSRN